MSITGEHAGKLDQLRRPTFTELYLPKLVTVWREGYGLADLRADVFAGLTVAIVALPLSMAIAIASGVTPDRGLYTAVVGGFIASLLGGSRFQIGGPAGAFIVLVAATADRHLQETVAFRLRSFSEARQAELLSQRLNQACAGTERQIQAIAPARKMPSSPRSSDR